MTRSERGMYYGVTFLLLTRKAWDTKRRIDVPQTPQTMMREWVRILLACEAEAGTVSGQNEPATVRVYERLRGQLSRLVGVGSFHALASRALTLAKSISPGLGTVAVGADGYMFGLSEVESKTDWNPDSGGVILIAQLLGLFLTLLGDAATLQLIEDLRSQLEITAQRAAPADGTTVLGAAALETTEALEALLQEIDRLRSVSERLETMADKHAGMEDGLVSVAGNIRSIAAVLDVFTLIRSKSEALQENPPGEPSTRYLM